MLQADIEALFDHKPETYTAEHFRLFETFKEALNRGEVFVLLRVLRGSRSYFIRI